MRVSTSINLNTSTLSDNLSTLECDLFARMLLMVCFVNRAEGGRYAAEADHRLPQRHPGALQAHEVTSLITHTQPSPAGDQNFSLNWIVVQIT